MHNNDEIEKTLRACGYVVAGLLALLIVAMSIGNSVNRLNQSAALSDVVERAAKDTCHNRGMEWGVKKNANGFVTEVDCIFTVAKTPNLEEISHEQQEKSQPARTYTTHMRHP